MHNFKRILVHVDAMAAARPALDRAIKLARHVGAALKIVDVEDRLPSRTRQLLPTALQTRLVDQRAERFATIAAETVRGKGRGLSISTEMLSGPPAVAIVRDVLRHGHDVVLKTHASPGTRRRGPLFDALDLQLLRKCPCPVWMVGPQPLRKGRVLAAIDPNPEDPAEEALNLRIVEMGLYLTQAEYRELVILNVWNAFGTSLLSPLATDDEVSAYVEAARESAGKDLDACLAPVRERLDKAILRLEEGEPGTFIPAFAASEEIDLVVMGTVARTGITGLLMGNTAERILGALSCSVLTVKPDGFCSPITLEDCPGG